MSLLLVVAVSFISTVHSQECVPANTCFESVSDAFGTNSLMWTCSSSGAVTELQYSGVDDCSSSHRSTSLTGQIHDGVDAHTGSGSVTLDYLQGIGCPTLSSSPGSCTDYMVIKRYGSATNADPDGVSLPYQDIGDNCVNKNQLYGIFVLPKGCLRLFTGSNNIQCNSTHFGWTQYESDTCTGTIRDAQNDVFQIGTCGYFSDDTKCYGTDTSGQEHCLQEWYYYFEEVCGCTIECSSVYNSIVIPSPTAVSGPSGTTPTAGSTPTVAAGTPTTAAGTPTVAAGTPTVAAGTPTTAAGTPTTAAGTPTTSSSGPSGNTPTAPTSTSGSYMRICAFAWMLALVMMLIIF